jgi:hypothetical protein
VDKWTKVTRESGPMAWEKTSHPSYGLIGVSRVSGHVSLFASGVTHQHFIAIRIKEADRLLDGMHEMIHGRSELCEVYMSESQFAQMITSMNVSDGAPCTIRYCKGDKPYEGERFGRPMPPEPAHVLEPFRVEADSRVAGLSEILRRAQVQVSELREGVSRPTKANLKTLADELNHLERDLTANLDYIHKSLMERLEKEVVNAKTEFEAYVNNRLQERGLMNLTAEAPKMINAAPEG